MMKPGSRILPVMDGNAIIRFTFGEGYQEKQI